jgi:hypothetical protein
LNWFTGTFIYVVLLFDMPVLSMSYKLSPVLFAAAKVLYFVSGYVAEPESSLFKGVAAFLEVITVYLLAKGIILGLRLHAKHRAKG